MPISRDLPSVYVNGCNYAQFITNTRCISFTLRPYIVEGVQAACWGALISGCLGFADSLDGYSLVVTVLSNRWPPFRLVSQGLDHVSSVLEINF